MAEKVLFEYRAEKERDGYHYILRRGDQSMEIKSTLPIREFASKRQHGGCARHLHHQDHHAVRSRRAVRKTLDAFEQMYREIYGNEATSQDQLRS